MQISCNQNTAMQLLVFILEINKFTSHWTMINQIIFKWARMYSLGRFVCYFCWVQSEPAKVWRSAWRNGDVSQVKRAEMSLTSPIWVIYASWVVSTSLQISAAAKGSLPILGECDILTHRHTDIPDTTPCCKNCPQFCYWGKIGWVCAHYQ